MKLEQVGKTCNSIMDEVGKAIVGKREIMERVMLAVLCDGHLLFEDFPGLAKTLMAKSFAVASGCDFKRVQFTPDLLPADITGTYVFRRDGGSFELRKGPVFANILLADEINRAPPKTQAALLEAMQEKQVTLEGRTHPLPRPFIVLATQNPLEYEGTYPLPEAQVDRFLLKTEVGYPSVEEEKEILGRRKERKRDEVDLTQVCSPEIIMEMQAAVEQVHVEDSMRDYIVSIVEATRNNSQLEVGASPRGSLALMRLSMTLATINGRDYIIPDDVKKVAIPALAHRLILQPDPWIKGVRAEQILGRILMEIPVPKVE
jgi:MoxR-like ATPase